MTTASKSGRPTKYRDEYCEKLVEHLSQGRSLVSFAASVKVCEDTIYEWFKVHKRFSEHKKLAMAGYQAFWEDIGLKGMLGKIDGFGHSNWIFNMKCRFKWKETQEIQQTSKIEINIDNEDSDL